ncbi:MAG: glycosyl hydrolase family 28-related protein [Planctomycetota bacterium]|nr:glycosyl hydrolase family 28-related protein [Planctomycetota bacterium]
MIAARVLLAAVTLGTVTCAFEPARAQGIQFPVGAGIVNVRDFGAVGNGVADDTAALNAAFASARAPGSSAKFIYMPDGVYRITSTVFFTESRTTLQGQSRAGTIIRLDPNAAGFASPDGSGGFIARNVLSTRENTGFSANEFVTSIFDLTVEVGAGNPGAVGVKFHCNNQGTLRNVTVRALDPATGHIGVSVAGNDKGPGMIRGLVVEGFRVGIDAGGTEYSWVFENTTLRNQRQYGVFNFWNILTFRGLVSENTVPVLWNDLQTVNNFPWGMATIIDGSFTTPGGAPAPTAAILSRTTAYLRNVTSSGYPSLIEQGGVNQPFTSVPGEWTSDRAFAVHRTQPAMLNLPVQDTPEVPWDAPATWASVTSFGAIPNDNADDAAAFQAAIDSGAATVYAPIGRYLLGNTVVLRGNVRRLFLTQSQLASTGALRASSAPMLSMDDAGPAVTVVERANFDPGPSAASVENTSTRTLVLRNAGADNVRMSGPGTTFVEDVVGGPWTISAGHTGYFRQCNPENEGVKITNDGATLWILGLKTEKPGTPLVTTGGGTTELIGGNIYPVNTLPLDQPLLKTVSARVSAIIGGSAYATDAFHRIFAEETRGGVLRRIFASEVPGRVGFFIGPRVAFYAADSANVPPPGSGPLSHYALNEGAGTTVSDSAGGPSATASGPSWTAGQIGAALSFDGVDDFVSLPNNRGGSSAGTISLWARTTRDFSDLGMMFYATSSGSGTANGGGTDAEMHLHFNPDDSVSLFIEGGASDLNLNSGRPLNDGAWHHLVATWDLAGYADLYVDGQRVASARQSWLNFPWSAFTRLGRPAAATRFYQGSLDDVRVYERAITHAEVNDLFDAGRGYANYPPNVTAGIDQSVQDSSYTAALNGQAVDDGQPFGPPAIAWTVRSAPAGGNVTFSNAADPRASATFSAAGTYVLRLTISDGVETRFDEMSVNVYDPLPAPWDNADQGDTAAFGWASYAAPNQFTLNGSGRYIDGFPAAGCDGFHFAYVPLGATVSTNIVARVTGVSNTNPGARAGVMFRQDLSGGCIANAFVGVTSTGDVVMTARSGSFGGTSVVGSAPAVGLPVWVRLERLSANQVRGSYSLDGVAWTVLASPVVNTGTLSTFFGLANSAYNNGAINVATFDRVLVGPRLACAGNADGDAAVAFSDVTSVLANFGAAYPPATLGPGDANADLVVNFSDVTAVLANFGSACP